MSVAPPIDWHEVRAAGRRPSPVVDPRRRMRWLLGAMVGLLGVVLARAAYLEATQGEAFREEAARALWRRREAPGMRGRILARDGTVLACDEQSPALAVHYRYLEEPPDPRWLRLGARARLSGAERSSAARLAEEEARLLAERRSLAERLARLAGLSAEEWRRRAARVQARVERIAAAVNCGKGDESDLCEAPSGPLRGKLDSSPFPPPARLVVAEELDYHVMAEDVPLAVVAEIEAHAADYPGVRILESVRRRYPAGRLAAHVLGHLAQGAQGPEGRSGVERACDPWLRGRPGVAVDRIDHGGRVLSSHREKEPGVGRDVVLTIDPALQKTAESLLDAALQRGRIGDGAWEKRGGAVVVMDARHGAILAAASAPGFDPNLFSGGDPRGLAALLDGPGAPLLDRCAQMALPPGSVFKTLTAIALLESGELDPYEPFTCRGYLRDPDRLRCQIFVRRGVGHGEVTLGDALAQSCNVYFFHHAARVGPGPLVHWAARFGFGQVTGVDLPGETPGNLPSPAGEGDAQLLAVGQGRLEVTPLQVARLMAAVANGGRLVTPHVASRLGLAPPGDGHAGEDPSAPDEDPVRPAPPRPVPGLHPATLEAVRQGLKRVVADHAGTAHGTVHLDAVEVAGKTGTAETGSADGDHAWFAGYVPADDPRAVLVVVLQHAGSGSEAAGPVARRLVMRMDQLGYFGRR